MAQYLLTDYKDTTVRVYGLSGTTILQIGGDLHRESPVAASTVRNETNRAATIFGRAFVHHGQRIYKFDPDAYYVPVGSYSTSQAGFHGFSAGDTWSTDGGSTTGTFLEDGVSTDGYILVKFSTGSPNINNTDVITITSGAGTGTATATADASQGGGTGELGEWGVVHVLEQTVDIAGTGPSSGLHALNINGTMGLAMVYKDSSNDFQGVKYDVVNDSWSEDLDLLTGIAPDEGGRSTVIGQTIYWLYESANAGRMRVILYTPTTSNVASIESASLFINGSSDLSQGLGFQFTQWKGRIFSFIPINTSNRGALVELSGGTLSQHIEFIGSTTVGDLDVVTTTGQRGNLLFVHGDKLWVFFYADSNQANSQGWAAAVFSNIGGVVTCDNMRADGTIASADNPEDLAQFLLGSGLAFGGSAGLTGAGVKWRSIRNEEANDPDGQDIMELFHLGNSDGGTTDILQWPAPFATIPGGTTIDWSTTSAGAGDTFELTTNQDPTGDIAVNDWVQDPDGQIFRVSAINVGRPGFDVENPNKANVTIQETGTSNLKLVAPTTVGISGAIAALGFPDEDIGGGGRIFTKGIKSIIITAIESDTNSEKVSFMANGGGIANKAELFHGINPDVAMSAQSTLVAASVTGGSATQNVNTVEDINADGTTVYTVRHDVVTDNLDDLDTVKRGMKIFT